MAQAARPPSGHRAWGLCWAMKPHGHLHTQEGAQAPWTCGTKYHAYIYKGMNVYSCVPPKLTHIHTPAFTYTCTKVRPGLRVDPSGHTHIHEV